MLYCRNGSSLCVISLERDEDYVDLLEIYHLPSYTNTALFLQQQKQHDAAAAAAVAATTTTTTTIAQLVSL